MRLDKYECEMALSTLYDNNINHLKEYQILNLVIEKYFKVERCKTIYCIYDGKNEEFLFSGNVYECCEFLNVTRKKFYNVLYNSRHKPVLRRRKYIVFSLEEEEEDA